MSMPKVLDKIKVFYNDAWLDVTVTRILNEDDFACKAEDGFYTIRQGSKEDKDWKRAE